MTTLFGNLLGGRSLRTRPAKIYFVPCSSLFASCLPQDPGAEAFVLSAASIKGQADHRLRPLNHLLLNKKVPPTCNLEEGANFRCCYITLIVYSRTGKPTLKKLQYALLASSTYKAVLTFTLIPALNRDKIDFSELKDRLDYAESTQPARTTQRKNI